MDEKETASTPPPGIPAEATPVSTPIASRKKKGNLLLILIGLGMVVAILALGYFLYQYLYPAKVSDIAKEETTTSATTSATEKDETADWKTLTNENYGFSIKYPQEWSDKTCDGQEISFLAPSTETLGVCQSEFGGLMNLSFTPDFKYEDYIAQQPFVDLSGLNNGKREEKTVAGEKAIRISGTYKEDSFTIKKDAQKILYLIDHDGGVLSINYYSEPTWGDYSEEFEQAIMTLKFLP